MYYTYILFSKLKPRTYVGSTADLDKRLKEHNLGKVRATKGYMPLELIYREEFDTLKEARSKELFFKTTTGRRRIREIIEGDEKIFRRSG